MSLLQFLSLDAPSWVPVADIVVKATLMFAAASAAAFVLRKASAAVRHMIWMLALAGVVVLPILSIALPRWQMNLVTFETVSSFQLPASSFQSPVSSSQPAEAAMAVFSPSNSTSLVRCCFRKYPDSAAMDWYSKNSVFGNGPKSFSSLAVRSITMIESMP